MRYKEYYDEGTLPMIAELIESEFDEPIEELAEDESGCYHGTKWISPSLIVRIAALAFEMGQENPQG